MTKTDVKSILCIFGFLLLTLFVGTVYNQTYSIDCVEQMGVPVTHLFGENQCLLPGKNQK
jgi:hypothetical protein